MREIHVQRPHFNDPDEPVLVQYRSISALAVVGLIVGLLSWLAVFSQPLWILPPAGLILNVMALRRIAASAPAMVGRKAALAGLLLSAAFCAAGPVHWTVYRLAVRNEARQFGLMWFDLLARGEPHKAVELQAAGTERPPLDDDLWQTYPQNSRARRDLEVFLGRPSVRALLALRDKAIVHYYDTEAQWRDRTGDSVYQTYAVTCPVEGEPTTFFVGLRLERSREPSKGRAFWRIESIEDAVKPRALGNSGKRQ